MDCKPATGMNCHRFRAEAMRSDVAMKFEHFVVEGVGN